MLHNKRDTFKGMFASDEGDADVLRRLADRAAIADLLTIFAVAIDSCDWPRYRSVFTDEIDLDYSSWRAGSIGRWAADDWVARAALLFPGLTASRHGLTKVLVTLDPADPDRARVRADVSADHVIVDDAGVAAVFTLDGYYDDRCVRTADGWRIEGKRLVVQWTSGDPTVMDAARARATTDPHGRP
jgi:SnoaL-like domain